MSMKRGERQLAWLTGMLLFQFQGEGAETRKSSASVGAEASSLGEFSVIRS